MAVFSGNPADRRLGAAPGSVAEAARSRSSMTNGVSRGTPASSLGRDLGDRGFRADVGGVRSGSMKDQGRIGAAAVVNTGAKGGFMGTVADRQAKVSGIKPPASMSTGPVSRNIQKSTVSAPPARMSGIQDTASIVPGRVTFGKMMGPFTQKNPSLAKYVGGTKAKPVNVSIAEAKTVAKKLPKTGAYVSGANWAAKMGLPKEALTSVGTVKKGYATTTVKAGPSVVDISYPKNVVIGKEGTFVPAARQSTGPVSRGVPTAPRMSTGPVSRGVQVQKQPAPAVKPTVSETRQVSRQKKAAAVTNKVVKGGYVYTRVGNKLLNFGAANPAKRREK